MMKYKSLTLLIFFISLVFLNSAYLVKASSANGIDVNLHVGSCNNNGICDTDSEDFFSCPADCTPIIIPPPPLPSPSPSPSDHGKSSSGSLVMDNIFNDLTVEVSYNNATIKWKSPIPTISSLKWGTNTDYKDGIIKNINFLLDHKVEITNLKDGTIYYFTIEATNLLGKTNSLENQVFRTLSLLDTTPPSNPTNVQSFSDASGITVSWNNPPEEDFDYIHIMRNTDRYYGSPYIGSLVYEGKGTYFTDSNVKTGTRYFYSLFSRDRAGNYSSGSLIDLIHNPKGSDTWGSILTPTEIVEPLKEKYIVTQGSGTYDFKIGSILYLSGDEPINIKTDYVTKTRNDDLWVAIRNSNRGIIGQYFFSRVRDKDGYLNVTIPSFDQGGYYNIAIYNYSNNLAKIVNQGAFQISKASTTISGKGDIYYKYILGFIIILLIILILIIILYKLFKKKNKHKNEKSD